MAKKTLYEVLCVTPNATDAQIRDAFQRLLQRLESGASGLDHAEAAFQISLAKQAFWTLSDNMRRSAYDASLAAPLPEPPIVDVQIRNKSSLVPVKLLAYVIGGLLALGMLLQVAFSIANHNRALKAANDAAGKDAAIKDYELTNGVSSPAEIAANQIREEEERRKNEERRQEIDRERAERKLQMELEKNRQYAERVSNELHSAEDRARREAEYKIRRAEEEERIEAAKERQRQEDQRRMWQNQLRK